MAPPHRLSGRTAHRSSRRAAALVVGLLVVVVGLAVPAALGVRPLGALDRAAATDLPPAVADAGLRGPVLVVTEAGGPVPVVVAGLLLAVALAVRAPPRTSRLPAPVLLLAAGPVLAHLTTVVLKLVVASPRPDLAAALTGADGFSMPSGHATVGAALATAVVLAVGPRLASAAARAWLVLAAVLAAVADGVSRVLLGVHWVSDVLAGWSVGVLVVVLLAAALGLLRPGAVGASRP